MDDASETLKPWVTFAGCVLVVVVLYWAQAVLVPIALAILLTFVLTPPVTWLERWVGRLLAVLTIVTLLFAAIGLCAWGLARQMDHLAEDLPRFRANILTKIADVRGRGKGVGRKAAGDHRGDQDRPRKNRGAPGDGVETRRRHL